MQLIALDPDDLTFPNPHRALDSPNGLLAIGGDLSPQRLLAGYQRGIFAWFTETDPILWWSPDPRCIITPEQLHISRSLARWRRQQRYQITVDQAFSQVVAGCAAPRPDQSGTWILPEMRQAFEQLHQQKVARSVEVWLGDELVGGLFGIQIGQAVFGESMFSTKPNASKFALAALLRDQVWGELAFLDTQFATEHLLSMGAEEISRADFLRRLEQATTQPAHPAR